MTIPAIKFGHVAFRVSDVEQSVRWYHDAFGARKVFHAPRDGERQELMFLEFAKGQFIGLFTEGREKPEMPKNAIGYQHFCLAVDDIQQMLEHLARMNVAPERPVREGRSHYRIAFVTDPDGNVIELMEIRPESAIYRA
jgi:catechol 2,3-dioxygenase-like lactoylglutathione lyase family enzyme